ncbi:MAG: ATP synthase subunit I [Neisseria sp.]|nr:ATP synthase subunit I [Neisseria sp.]
MLKIILLQILLGSVAVGISGIFGGSKAAGSALLGGLSYLLPSVVAALILNISRRYPELSGYGFILGEGLRIVLALVFMVCVFAVYAENLAFLPFLFGLLVVSHVFFIVFWKVKSHGR